MYYIFILAIIVGIIQGLGKMTEARHGIGSVAPSKNLFTFLFMDKY